MKNRFKIRFAPVVRLIIAIALAIVFNDHSAAQSVAVEGQPLAANVKRMLDALDSIGHSLNASDELMSAINSDDAEKIQTILDQQVLAVVTINPEERVSAKRGPAKANLQQSGYIPFVIKVINQSTSTPRLNISSPQAGAVYAGSSRFILERQQQTKLADREIKEGDEDKFLDVEVFRKPPMTETLSGLEVEYVLSLISSSEAGKREATLEFDIGEGTNDLGFRSKLPILFDVAKAIPVSISVQDENGKPSIARIEIRDAQGRVYPPQEKRVAPDFFFQSHIYRKDGETIGLPPGKYMVTHSRGPEYLNQKSELIVTDGQTNDLKIKLMRWINPRQFGFISGDHHIHAAGCSHYTSPTEGVTPEDMFRQVKGEALNVGCVLTWGPCFEFQRNYFDKKPKDFGDNDTIIKYDLEISGFGSQALGHVCLLNLQNQTYPGSEGTKERGWPTWTTPVMRWAKEQGGITGYAHSASGLAITTDIATRKLITRLDQDKNGWLEKNEANGALLPYHFEKIDKDQDQRISSDELLAAHESAADELPNYAIPDMNGVGAMEICVSTAAGVCDFISAMDTERIQEWNTWYHLLNCGFETKVSGETDFPCMSSRRVGQGRVYVNMPDATKSKQIDYAAWCDGLAKGRSYVSDGFAHVLDFQVSGKRPGNAPVQLKTNETDEKKSVTIIAKVAFAPETPVAVAQGTLETVDQPAIRKRVVGDTIELHAPRSDRWISGGRRLIEIVVNGQPVAEEWVAADGKIHELKFEVEVTKSSWVALRQFPQLHTNPVNVIVNKKPIRVSARSAQWCIDMTKQLWENRKRNIAQPELEAARDAFELAFQKFEKIKQESASK